MKGIIDLHCDTLLECMLQNKGLSEMEGHINLEKLKQGGSLAQCFAIFIPTQECAKRNGITDGSYEVFQKLYRIFEQEMQLHSSEISQVKTAEEIRKNHEAGKLSAILTVEDSVFLEGDIRRVDEMADKGVRMASLIWNYENSLGYPNSRDDKLHGLGLKPFGIEAVQRMNELNIIADVSHLSEGGFWDVLKHSKKPIAASHSCARALCNHPRNLTDEQLKALGNAGGVAGVNFYSCFLAVDSDYTSDDMILQHIVYMVDKAGIESVAMGSDFDGIDCGLEMKDAAGFPQLLAKMSKHFTDDQIEKIAHKNFLRVFEA